MRSCIYMSLFNFVLLFYYYICIETGMVKHKGIHKTLSYIYHIASQKCESILK